MKAISLESLLLIACLFSSIAANAFDFGSGKIYYNITSPENRTVEVTYREKNDKSYSGSIVIPVSVKNEGISYSITSIGEWAFSGCTGLVSVAIGNSVTSIGSGAFTGCTGLTDITIPNSVTEFGWAVFEGCESLKSVTIGKSVTDISGMTFNRCAGLKKFIVDSKNNNYSVLDGVLFNKDKTTIIYYPNAKSPIYTIPESVTSIGNYAFMSCTSLTSVTIPNTVTKIESGAFWDCIGLTSVTIPNSVDSIGTNGGYTFSSCTSLKEIHNYSKMPQSISADDFDEVDKTTCTLYVPKGSMEKYSTANVWKDFTNIEENAYDFKSGGIYYDIISIENKTVTVSNDGDNSYSGLVVIPASVANEGTTYSVTSIGVSAFGGCSGLTGITIPNSVIWIEEDAFYKCTGLTSITLPNSVTSIGMFAFEKCSGLTNITIPNSVTWMERGTFDGCESLTSITISNLITEIGPATFNKCKSLTSIKIPDSVTFISNDFTFFECTGLKEFIVASGNPSFSALDGVLFNKNKTTIVAYPNAKSPIYTIPNTVKSIGAFAFYGCSGLTSVSIPNTVRSIEEYAFHGCAGITKIYNYSKAPQSIKTEVFDDFDKTKCTLYVPIGSMAQYKAAAVWKEFKNILEFEPTQLEKKP